MTRLHLNPRKSPLQGRSQATWAAILEAAARILEAEGRRGLTTNRIAERAGVSVGSLYQYFPGKEAIVVALIREMRREMFEDFRQAAAGSVGKDLATTTAALVRASVQHHIQRPELAAALEREEAELPLDDETQALKARIRLVVEEVLMRHAIPDAQIAAFDIIAMCKGMVQAFVRADEDDFCGLCRRIDKAVSGYLVHCATP